MSLLFLLLLLPQLISTFPSFQNRIPNGNKVVNPCNPSAIWTSVGHQRSTEDGRLNLFGLDFLAKGKKWQAVCNLDSDGDGRSNGEELGDPECIWQNNQTILPQTGEMITHPGICEPINSPACVVNNAFLMRIPECVTAMALLATQTTPTTKKPVPTWCPPLANEDYQTLTYTLRNVTVPAREATYMCQQFNMPNDANYHIIAWEPILANPSVVHHLMMFVCDDAQSYARLTGMGGYLVPKECGMMPACQTMILAWGAGEGNRCYDPNVGVAMGKTKYTIAVMQILYSNPSAKQSALITDSSGIRLYYTSRLRPNENAMILVGQEALAIPPATPMTSFVSRSFASTICSKKRLSPYSSYKLTGALFHMHKIGMFGRLSIVKGDQTIDIVNDTTAYGNGTALVKSWSSNDSFVLEPGDNIEIECRYDSTARSTWTFYGPTPNDEMCFAYIDVYPKPLDRLFQILDNVGRIDQCMFEDEKIGNCSMADFHAIVTRILQGTGGGFIEHCGCSIFPATACTLGCYTFLVEWNLLNHPCLTEENGMTFHVGTRFWAVPQPADSFSVLSQVTKCASLTTPPSSDLKCANNPDQVILTTPIAISPPTTTTITTPTTTTATSLTNATTIKPVVMTTVTATTTAIITKTTTVTPCNKNNSTVISARVTPSQQVTRKVPNQSPAPITAIRTALLLFIAALITAI